jgi:apolipoprotein D and lipocalin family protein
MTMQRVTILLIIQLVLSGCGGMNVKPIPTVTYVDLPRFMGDWYVIANIPTLIEKDAHNAVESYKLNDDGTIATTFTFNAGGFNGERKEYRPKGFVEDKASNAVWGMQFLWPFKAEYRVAYVDEAYSMTIIARSKLDYVWIMARTPNINEADYQQLVSKVASLGYDISTLQRVPQQGKN